MGGTLFSVSEGLALSVVLLVSEDVVGFEIFLFLHLLVPVPDDVDGS